MSIGDEAVRIARQNEFTRKARERVAKMDPELKARLQPAVDWVAAEIEKVKRETS